MISSIAKRVLESIRCSISDIKYLDGVYIGRQYNIKGGKNIHLSPNVTIRNNVDLWANADLYIGNGTEIGDRCRISISNTCHIGSKVLFSPNVYITDNDHEYRNIDIPVIDQGVVKADNYVSIGSESYIGINSVIVGNVSIGTHCVIGANSVVTSDIPDFSVAVGAPAKVIKQYDKDKGSWRLITDKHE